MIHGNITSPKDCWVLRLLLYLTKSRFTMGKLPRSILYFTRNAVKLILHLISMIPNHDLYFCHFKVKFLSPEKHLLFITFSFYEN